METNIILFCSNLTENFSITVPLKSNGPVNIINSSECVNYGFTSIHSLAFMQNWCLVSEKQVHIPNRYSLQNWWLVEIKYIYQWHILYYGYKSWDPVLFQIWTID